MQGSNLVAMLGAANGSKTRTTQLAGLPLAKTRKSNAKK